MYGEGKTRGRVGELGIDATINQACAAVQLADPNLRAWVRAVLDDAYLELRRAASGGVQPNLNLSLVRTITIPVPPVARRDRLLAQLRSAAECRACVERQIDMLQRRATVLRRAVLAAAFYGRLTGDGRRERVDRELAEISR